MGLYARGTRVPVERSRAEIERLVRRFGATAFGLSWGGDRAVILFEARGRHLRFELPLPQRPKFASADAFSAEERRRWRCLLLAIRAKFEAISNGIALFDDEFLANIVVPGTRQTVGERIAPSLAAAYERGAPMPLLLGSGEPQ